jgi:hypothetical protein
MGGATTGTGLPFPPLGYWHSHGPALVLGAAVLLMAAVPIIIWLVRRVNIECGTKAPSADVYEP